MSPTYDEFNITGVLLADGWQNVRGESFHTGPFTLKNASDQASWAMGDAAWWKNDKGNFVIAPRTSILAVRAKLVSPERTPGNEITSPTFGKSRVERRRR